jgi:hypothetical protein
VVEADKTQAHCTLVLLMTLVLAGGLEWPTIPGGAYARGLERPTKQRLSARQACRGRLASKTMEFQDRWPIPDASAALAAHVSHAPRSGSVGLRLRHRSRSWRFNK